jgi:hypothetical protein
VTSTKHRTAALVLAAVAATTALAGCESDELESALAEPGPSSSGVALVCAKDAKPVELPESFPDSAALPAGYVVTGLQTRSGDRTVVTAVAPKSFSHALPEMRTAFSTRGWTASDGEVEERDAESNFSGNGLRGRWAIREIPDCTDNTSVSVLIGR